MGRCAEFKGVDQVAEALLGILIGEAQSPEHGLLGLGDGDPDGAATQFGAVEHDVIGLGPAVLLVGLQLVQILVHGGGEGVVHGHIAVLLLGELEHGELGDPKELEVPGIQNAQLLGALAPQGAQGGKDHFVLCIAHDEHQVSVLGVGTLQNGAVLLFSEELLIGGGHLAVMETGPGQTLGLIGLNEVSQLVDLLPGEVSGVAVYIDEPHGAALGHGAGEYAEAAVLHNVADVLDLKAEAQVGFVRAEAVHSLPPGHPQEGSLHIHVQHFLEYPLQEALLDLHHVILVDEGHLQVDLGELGLAIGPQILVPEAAGDLHIAVKAGQHQQLLVLLGGLGQGIKFARMDAGGDQIIPGALGGGLGQHGGLDLQEALLVKVVPGHFGHLVAGGDGMLHIRAAQVQIAVLQAEHIVGLGVLHDLKGRGLGLGQQPQLTDIDLDVAGGDLVGLALALPHQASGGHDVLRAQGGGLFKNILGGAVIKGQLHQTGAVPQVHKDQAAQVPLTLDPAAQGDGLARVAETQLAAVVGAAEVLQIVHKINSIL